MKLDIVMLQCGFSDLTVRCLESIYATYDDCRVILVDNGSGFDDVNDALRALNKRDSIYLRNTENLGFARAVNEGLVLTRAPFVCIQNNDTVVFEEGYERMIGHLQADPLLGLIGPMTNSANSEQVGVATYGAGHRYTSGLVAFFCTVIPRSTLERVGYLSEDYGLGYGEDDDYCIRVRRAGLELGIAQDVYVHHDHHVTYRSLFGDAGIHEMGMQGLAVLKKKYG